MPPQTRPPGGPLSFRYPAGFRLLGRTRENAPSLAAGPRRRPRPGGWYGTRGRTLEEGEGVGASPGRAVAGRPNGPAAVWDPGLMERSRRLFPGWRLAVTSEASYAGLWVALVSRKVLLESVSGRRGGGLQMSWERWLT